MLNKSQCQKIVERAVFYARKRAQGVEVSIDSSTVATSRFALGSMTQNQAPVSTVLSFRVMHKGRQTRVETNNLSASGIYQAIDNAIAACKLLPVDDQMLPLVAPGKIGQMGESGGAEKIVRFDRATCEITAAERAARVKEALAVGASAKLKASGIYATGANTTAIGNSNGLFAYHRESFAEYSVTMEGASSSGWAKDQSTNAKDIDVSALAKEAARTADLSKNPIAVEPGKYTVILTPSAVLDLVSFLWYDFAATSHKDKLSSLTGKLGQKVFGENISITDDYAHPLQAGEPFDGEGLTRQKIELVKNGVFANMVLGRRMAKEYSSKSTGHGLREPSPEGEMPMNIVMAGGDKSLEEMVRTTDKGIFVSRVWYVRPVDPATVLLTGMTRDGTFLIRDGQLKQGLLNLRFNVSVIEMLNQVIALSPALRAAGEEGYPAVVPAMKVADFNFSSVAKH